MTASACALVSHISRENCCSLKESQSASGLSSLGGPPSAGNLSSANYGESSPSLSNRSMAPGGYGEPAGLGLSAASLPYDGGSPYA